MALTDQEERIEREAMEYARAQKKAIARRLTDPAKFLPERNPVSVFMAGSPGAGKTEASVELLKEMDGNAVIRVDPDELRSEFPGYTGNNAWLFQKAVSILVDRIHDVVLDQRARAFCWTERCHTMTWPRKTLSGRCGRNVAFRYFMFIRSPDWLGSLCRPVRHRKGGEFSLKPL